MQEVRKFDKRRYSIAICALLVSLSGTAYGDDGVSTPDVTPEREKGYILTPVEEEGENTITKYEVNTETGELEPKYYDVDLAKTEYGSGSENTLYYNWEKDSDGNYTLQEGASATGDNSIIYNYDSSDSLSRQENPTGDVVGNFIKNNISSTSSSVYGGAIRNTGTIGNITGDFIGNYASSEDDVYGGAIRNTGTIGNITGDFIGNYASGSYDAYGGAIYNAGSGAEIGDITGDFVGNYASGSSEAYGGAIYNDNSHTIGDITGDFVGNYASGSYEAYGGAIYNSTGYLGTIKIGDITGDFIGNYASGTSASGGAIYNDYGTIGDITGDFVGNYASGSYANGGAIYNDYGTIGDITGDFVGNYASGSYNANGGAISNGGAEIGNITGDFVGNYAQASGSKSAYGGAIYNYHGTIGDITGDFVGNYASGSYNANGGAIYNNYNGTIGDITGDFIGNYAQTSGFYAYGGAICTDAKIGEKDSEGNLVGGIYGSFLNNYAKTESSSNLALGGAVYTTSDMNFIADGKDVLFSGNYTEDSRGKINNAIFVGSTYSPSSPTISLKAENNGTITFNDQIDGGKVAGTNIDRTTKYNLKLTGDSTGKIQLNDKVINANATLDEVTLHLTKADILETSTLTANSGHLSLMNGLAETQLMQGMNVKGHIGMSVDVDLAAAKMDRLPEGTVVSDGAKIDVEYLNLLNDAEKDKTDILFAEESYKDKVSYTGKSPVAYSPIYKYDVSYSQDDGYFTFLRHGGTSGNPSESFNPTVLAPSVAAQAGGYATQMQTFNYAFQHADNFMNIPYLERISMKESGRYAMSPTGDATDVGVFSPLMTRVENNGYWVKPYVSFESIPLKNGPKVDNITYGSLIGYDSQLTPIAHGFDRVLTGYVGYNGASQSYGGVDSYQNGGLIGGTLTLYKGNFFNATTLSAGASVGETQNMYGTDNYTMLLAGIGNKLGYNFEFKNGKYIIQPAMLMSYTFVNTFDYKNAAGVRIESDPLHAIQLSPGVKFIMNTKNGWQPYAAVNMVWNILDKQEVRANDVRIPEMSIKPYVQYGLGVQKRIKDKFLAFGQAMVSNGGRNGVSLSFGLRWFLGD